MKKLILIALAIVIASICCSAVALASTTLQQQLKQLDGVEDVRIAYANDTYFVAVKPSGIMQKTECQKLRQQIIDTVKSTDDKANVVVSFSVKLFCHIEKIENLPEDLKQVEIERLMDKLSKIPMPLGNAH